MKRAAPLKRLSDELVAYLTPSQWAGETSHLERAVPDIWRFVAQLSETELDMIRMEHNHTNIHSIKPKEIYYAPQTYGKK